MKTAKDAHIPCFDADSSEDMQLMITAVPSPASFACVK
jgi:hypothetical protein